MWPSDLCQLVSSQAGLLFPDFLPRLGSCSLGDSWPAELPSEPSAPLLKSFLIPGAPQCWRQLYLLFYWKKKCFHKRAERLSRCLHRLTRYTQACLCYASKPSLATAVNFRLEVAAVLGAPLRAALRECMSDTEREKVLQNNHQAFSWQHYVPRCHGNVWPFHNNRLL